jgi:hypothetical protein
MLKVRDEMELQKIGFGIDPTDPTRALPIGQLSDRTQDVTVAEGLPHDAVHEPDVSGRNGMSASFVRETLPRTVADIPAWSVQRFKAEPLDDGKEIARLDAAAKQENEQAAKWEKYQTVALYRLGLILIALRPFFPTGWEDHLKDLGIDQTRWKRSKCLAEHFKSENECRDLPLEKALYAAGWGKKQKQGKKLAGQGQGTATVQRGVAPRHGKATGEVNGKPPQAGKTTDPRSAGEILAEFAAASGWNHEKQREVVVDFWIGILDMDGLLEDIDYYHRQSQFADFLQTTAQQKTTAADLPAKIDNITPTGKP